VTEQTALAMAANAMMTAAKLAAPIVLSAMAVGLIVSIFQSVTQIQESTLTFVPKLVVVGLVFVVAGHWMLGTYVNYVDSLFASIPQLLAGG
jgi:flagellar biosynthesis protein FliQ